ncbi:hypothetical protein VB780_21550 [Leptolyngbya sp. CCNP1308]|uniref:hypothetical protein n=1 Tax=Leptolyngbya sp. CCNP1308 TaxID=3110255 RepID=UPI002B21908E|nr:hypothetical protein [Leptolyngbya sp. CCNP1308]MEA5451180.1 hypothetical protein [Leptolyngbya sp. CCNP1308]
MQEKIDQEARDFLSQCELVTYSKAKRREFKKSISLSPYILAFISTNILIILTTPLHPKSLAISAFDFYSDSTKITSLTNFFAGFLLENPSGLWFIFLIGIFTSNLILGIPLFLPMISVVPSILMTEIFIRDIREKEEIKIKKISRATEKSRRNDDYIFVFAFLIPVIGFTITARADFSAGALYFVMGFFVMSYCWVLIIISVLAYAFLTKVRDSLFKQKFLDEYVICLLADCIKDITDRGTWRNIQSRRKIKLRLETIANIFQEVIPDQADIEDPEIRRNFRLIAGRFRSLNRWLFTPKEDTRLALIAELVFILKKYVHFDLDSLIPENEIELSGRKPIRKILNIVILTFKMSVPILLIFLFLKTPIAPQGPLRDYLAIGVFALTGLRILLAIDPGFGEALENLLNFIGKARNSIK